MALTSEIREGLTLLAERLHKFSCVFQAVSHRKIVTSFLNVIKATKTYPAKLHLLLSGNLAGDWRNFFALEYG